MSEILRPVNRTAENLRVVGVYATFAAFWILLSDWAVQVMFRSAELASIAGTLKGWVFVAITSMLLAWLLRQRSGRAAQSEELRQKNLRALRASEALHYSTITTLTEGVIVFDTRGTPISCNPSAERILGMTLADIQQRDPDFSGWKALREDLSKMTRDDMPAVQTLRTGKPCRGVLLGIYTTSGGFDWLLVNSEPLFDPETRQLVGVVCSFTDVSDIRHSSVSLHVQNLVLEMVASNLALTEIMRRAVDFIQQHYPHTATMITLADGNSDGLRIVAASGLSDAVGTMLDTLPIGAAGSASAEAIARRRSVVRRTEVLDQRFCRLYSEGGWRTWWSTPILGPDNTALGTLDMFMRASHEANATAQRCSNMLASALATAIEHQRSEETVRKLSLAVEQSPESIVITDLQGKIEYVNDTFVRVSGYSREELLGADSPLLQSGNTPPENFRALWDALNQGQSWKGEFYNRRKDGSEYVEFAFVAPISQNGAVTHYVAVKEDITEKKRIGLELESYRHRLEELVKSRTGLLVEAQRQAEEANRAKSAFLANMSHEIRTPMNAVIGLAELMRQDDPTPLQHDRLQKLEAAAKHLMSLINNLLDLSKIEAGRMELEQVDFSLAEVFEYVDAMIGHEAARRGVQVSIDSGDVPGFLRGDPTRLRQALLNYAANAVKFTERGSIVLRVRQLPSHDSGLLLRFEVEDTGPGIAPQDLPHLFQRFSQHDVSITRRYGGTGLGLAITRSLAELMGGEADAQSTPGCGSLFWFTARLEVAKSIVQPSIPAPMAAAALGHPAAVAVDMARADAVAQQLIDLLEIGDIAASEMVIHERLLLDALLGPLATALFDHIANFDYAAAARLLRSVWRVDSLSSVG